MEVGGRRHAGSVHLAQVAQSRAPGAVGSLVAHNEQERLVLVPVFQPLDGFVRDHVRGISGKTLCLAFAVRLEADKVRIVVAALAGEDFPRVEPGGVRFQMPFAEKARLVSGLLQHFRVSGLGAVQRSLSVEDKAVHVGMPAGQDAGAGGAAQGVGAVAAVKNHALASQFVEIGQGHGGIIIAGAQRLVGVVVRNDKEDIRFFIFLSLGLS